MRNSFLALCGVALVLSASCDPNASSASVSEPSGERAKTEVDDEERSLDDVTKRANGIATLTFERGTAFYRQLEPGDRVDVWCILETPRAFESYDARWQIPPPDETPEVEAAPCFTDLPVLGVDSPEEDADRVVVSVATTFDRARYLAMRDEASRLVLALRPPDIDALGRLNDKHLSDFEGELEELQSNRERRNLHRLSRARPDVPIAERLPFERKSEEETTVDTTPSPVAYTPYVDAKPMERVRAVYLDVPVPTANVSVGDHVSILGAFDGPPFVDSTREADDTVARRLLSDVEVLDVPGSETVSAQTVAPGVVVALTRREISLVLLAEHHGNLKLFVQSPGADISKYSDPESLEELYDRIPRGNYRSPRQQYQRVFDEKNGDVCDRFRRCVDRHEIDPRDAPSLIALADANGEVTKTGTMHELEGGYPAEASRCFDRWRASGSVTPPPGDHSVYVICKMRASPIIRNLADAENSDDESRWSTKPKVRFVNGHFPPSLGERMREVLGVTE